MPRPASAAQSTLSRKWVFTLIINDDTVPPRWDPDRMFYMIYQTEECPTTKRPHYQGFVALKSPARMSTVKKLLGNSTVHLENCRDQKAAIEYCKKSDTRLAPPVEFGTSPTQGKTTALAKVCAMLKSGTDMRTVAMEHSEIFVKHHKGLAALQTISIKPGDVDRKVYVITGKAGAGKTWDVRHTFPNEWIYTPSLPGKQTAWFCGYVPGVHKVVLFDDYDKESRMTIQTHKLITDKYAYHAPVKGGSVYIDAPIIVFTSNTSSAAWFNDIQDCHTDAISRRITKEWYLNGRDDPQHAEITAIFKKHVAELSPPEVIDLVRPDTPVPFFDFEPPILVPDSPLPLRRCPPDLPRLTGRPAMPLSVSKSLAELGSLPDCDMPDYDEEEL